MSIFFDIWVRIARYGPQIDQWHGENRLSHIIRGSTPEVTICVVPCCHNTLGSVVHRCCEHRDQTMGKLTHLLQEVKNNGNA